MEGLTKYTETKWDHPPSGVGVVVAFGEYYVVVRLTVFRGPVGSSRWIPG